jgi:hypothetical protein
MIKEGIKLINMRAGKNNAKNRRKSRKEKKNSASKN